MSLYEGKELEETKTLPLSTYTLLTFALKVDILEYKSDLNFVILFDTFVIFDILGGFESPLQSDGLV